MAKLSRKLAVIAKMYSTYELRELGVYLKTTASKFIELGNGLRKILSSEIVFMVIVSDQLNCQFDIFFLYNFVK